jgi:hypothetical protein
MGTTEEVSRGKPRSWTHDLKTVQPHFEAIVSGRKRFEIRKNDRGFQVGDKLLLREWNDQELFYTGFEVVACIAHILRDFEGLAPGYVALSLVPPDSSACIHFPAEHSDE